MSNELPNPIALETLVRATAFHALLDSGEPLQPTALADVIGVNPTTFSGVLDQLSQA